MASALHTLELLQAEKFSAATASVEAISRELALPLDDILSDATTVLDRYAGHDEDIIARLRHLIFRAREIRSLIQKVGSTITADPKREAARPLPAAGRGPPAGGRRRRDDPAVRAQPARQPGGDRRDGPRRPRGDRAGAADAATPPRWSISASPTSTGSRPSERLREVQPETPIILMTGFGYDPSHSIVKARQQGLQTVLYKPFRADRLIEAVQQALRSPSAEKGDERRPSPRPARGQALRSGEPGHRGSRS